jgi:GalNAc5-diNAcBac-PP-undecaprenol beta-1,3-glucosyltransferase
VSLGRSKPTVTVIIPTHNHPETLDLAIQSVLHQTVDSLDLVVIGDGVTDETRDVMAGLQDRRIRFVDEPKSSSRAETARHRILEQASSPYVCYLGDDDLMLSDHVGCMIEVLQRVDFTHPLPVYLDANGTFAVHPTDLSNPECLRWHLHPDHNAVSLSGVSHRLDAYRRLPVGWRRPPAGWHSDHYMWEQWIRTPGLTFATAPQLTLLKFEGSVRVGWPPERRRAELIEWSTRTMDADFPASLLRKVLAALVESSSSYRLRYSDMLDVARSEQASREWVQSALETTTDHVHNLERIVAEKDALLEQQGALLRRQDAHMQDMRNSRTWRFHDRVVASTLFRWANGRRGPEQSARTDDTDLRATGHR